MPVLRPAAYILAALFVLGAGVNAQTTAASRPNDRAQVIAASFSKSKHVSKLRRGVRREKYLDVKSVPAVRADPASYSGTYEVEDFGFSLQLRVASDGSLEGTGYETVDMDSGVRRRFTLRNARVDGALLTAAKIYAGGDQERFEGVFINRTVRENPNEAGTTEFGLGVIGKAVQLWGLTIDKFFYRQKVSGAAQ
jgi:hypothetical protein